jgi:hypothetical protein
MEADQDHDGKISFEEFTKMVENTDVSMSMTLGMCKNSPDPPTPPQATATDEIFSCRSILEVFSNERSDTRGMMLPGVLSGLGLQITTEGKITRKRTKHFIASIQRASS